MLALRSNARLARAHRMQSPLRIKVCRGDAKDRTSFRARRCASYMLAMARHSCNHGIRERKWRVQEQLAQALTCFLLLAGICCNFIGGLLDASFQSTHPPARCLEFSCMWLRCTCTTGCLGFGSYKHVCRVRWWTIFMY